MFIPKIITQIMNYHSGETVTHTDFNDILNLLLEATNHNSDAINKILNLGTFTVKNAEHADNADFAGLADLATLAETANHALEADHATTANSALSANNAGNATLLNGATLRRTPDTLSDSDNDIPSSKQVTNHVTSSLNTIFSKNIEQDGRLNSLESGLTLANNAIDSLDIKTDDIESSIVSLNPKLVPAGGNLGYVLTKIGNEDYDFAWRATSGGTVIVNNLESILTTAALSGNMGRVLNEKIETSRTITSEPTGFTNNKNITVSYNPTTRKVTLTGTFEAYYKGTKVEELTNGWESPAHADAAGNYYLCYKNGAISFTTTPWTYDCLHIAFVQRNSHNMAIREVHGFMPWQAHYEFHSTIGTYKTGGGTLSDYTPGVITATLRRPNVSDTTVQDEDLETTIPALTSKLYTQRYLTGVGVRTLVTDQPEIIPVTGNVPNYNQFTGGVWQQTPIPNNNYAAVFVVAVPVTADAGSQKFRYMFVQPQQVGALTTIQALTPNNLVHGDTSALVSEFVFISKIIIQVSGSNWSIHSVQNLTGTQMNQVSSPAGNYLSIVHHDATLSGDGTVASPLSVIGGGGGGSWGSITGTLTDQLDLVAALATKEDAFTKNTAFNKNFGSTAGTVTEGNDARLSDARTPLTHTHNASDVNAGTLDLARIPTITAAKTDFADSKFDKASGTSNISWVSNVFRITTANGYVNIGPANTGFCHFTTDRPSFYFDKSVAINGSLFKGPSYNLNVPCVFVQAGTPTAVQAGDIWVTP